MGAIRPTSRRMTTKSTAKIRNPKRAKPSPRTEVAVDDEYWNAIRRRDRGYDGKFYYCVSTTRIYCRPSCPARLAKRRNVVIFTSWRKAEHAGFRPCKRCRPTEASLHERNTVAINSACLLIEGAEREPSLQELARVVGISPYHFHRVFRSVVGMTPKAYAMACRQKRVCGSLKRSNTVTNAIYEAGFNSSARFYANSARMLGMTPLEFRAGGANAAMTFAVGQCSLGAILVAASAKGITAVLLGDDAEALVHELEDRFPKATLVGGDRDFEVLVSKVVGLVEAPRLGLDLPLDVRGTAFQHRVWQALREIPAGTTVTYAEIAARIGRPAAVRAVASACAANAIAVAIPCHRVVRTDGSLSGYRWGVDRKRALIARESKP